jgi:hypothetical protein
MRHMASPTIAYKAVDFTAIYWQLPLMSSMILIIDVTFLTQQGLGYRGPTM